MRNPKWTKDEIILALDLYFNKNLGTIESKNPLIVDLSILLNKLNKINQNNPSDTYRNPNGVSLKLSNFKAIDPSYVGRGMESYSKLDKELFFQFVNQRDKLKEIAQNLKDVITNKKSSNLKNNNKKQLDLFEIKNENIITCLSNAKDLLDLKEKELISKQNLNELIQKSKIVKSSFWIGEDYIIGNTPQQGINWIGQYPDIKAVIIKYKKGSYIEDGWVDNYNFNYSFKAQKGFISKTELANKVLIDQQDGAYPILLFTETIDKKWQFSGKFNVERIKENHVQLIKIISDNPEKTILKKNPDRLENTKVIKEYFINSFKNLKDFKFESGNPFIIKINNNKFYIFLKNISPAYFPNSPDIDRIQLPYSEKFNKIINSEIPFLILGYNTFPETFTAWDPFKIKERLNSKDNISLYTRKSFQKELKLNEFNEHYLSNGDKVVVFSINSTPKYCESFEEMFSTNQKNKQNLIENNKQYIEINDDTVLIKLEKLLKDDKILEAVNLCAERYQDEYPNLELNDWFKLVEFYKEKLLI